MTVWRALFDQYAVCIVLQVLEILMTRVRSNGRDLIRSVLVWPSSVLAFVWFATLKRGIGSERFILRVRTVKAVLRVEVGLGLDADF